MITQVYGEPASGKSTICLMTAIEQLKAGKKVIYIDTEGFSVERFRQIAGEDNQTLAEDLIIFEPVDFDLQGLMIGECDKLLKTETDIGLIVLDSATALYRVEGGRSGESQRKLGSQMIRLLGFARRYDIPVLVSNQVFMDIDQNAVSGLGGTSLRHISKVIIRLEKRTDQGQLFLKSTGLKKKEIFWILLLKKRESGPYPACKNSRRRTFHKGNILFQVYYKRPADSIHLYPAAGFS